MFSLGCELILDSLLIQLQARLHLYSVWGGKYAQVGQAQSLELLEESGS